MGEREPPIYKREVLIRFSSTSRDNYRNRLAKDYNYYKYTPPSYQFFPIPIPSNVCHSH